MLHWKMQVQRRIREDPEMLQRVAGGQDLEKVAESPLLTGRVVAQLAAEAGGSKFLLSENSEDDGLSTKIISPNNL